MEESSATCMKMVVARMAAVVAAGSLAFAASLLLGIDPLKPTLIMALAALARLAYRYRHDQRE